MGSVKILSIATDNRAIFWNRLFREICPMLKPTSTLTYVLACTIDVSNLHVFCPFELYVLVSDFANLLIQFCYGLYNQ